MNWISEVFSGTVEGAGKGVKETLTSVGDLAASLKTTVTGLLPPGQQAEIDFKFAELIGRVNEAQNKAEETITSKDWGSIKANLFMAGWRPAAGWLGVIGLFYATLGLPLLEWISLIVGLPRPPQVDSGVLVTLLIQLLGLGGLRTYEKSQNTHTRH